MTKIIQCCFAATLLLTGCTTDIGPAARKAGVNAIKVERHVDVDQPMRIGFKSDTGNLSVALAGIIVNEMYAQKLTRFGAEMRESRIDVPQMVLEAVVGILRAEKGFSIATNSADATLVVAIQQYGFDSSGLSMSKEVPFIALRAELTQKGERLWKGEGQAHPLRSSGLGAKADDYQAQPELLRDHWRIQIDRAARQLLSADAKEK